MSNRNEVHTQPCFFAPEGPYSNVAQILIDQEVLEVLRLCGVESTAPSAQCSDYERFFVFAECLPLLAGHPLKERTIFLLQSLFGISEELTIQNRDTIWKECADQLLRRDVTAQTVKECLSTRGTVMLTAKLPILENAPYRHEPSLRHSDFQFDGQMTWADWNTWAKHKLDTLEHAGENEILISVPKEYRFQKPDLYHIDLLLKKGEEAPQNALWLTQQARFLCEECKRLGWTLVLRFECNGNEAVRLFHYLQQSVGLPTLIWSSDDDRTNAAVIEYQRKYGSKNIYFALHENELVKIEDRATLYERVSKQYPFGRLMILTERKEEN